MCSTATTFALHNLTGNLEVQSKLRAELLAVPTDTPAMEQLNGLPYLDAVVRETMRLSPPVVYTTRIAFKDDVIPLDEPFTDKNGGVHHELRYVLEPTSDLIVVVYSPQGISGSNVEPKFRFPLSR